MHPVQKRLICSIMFEFVQAKIGRGRDCESALQRLRGKNADISEESAEIRVTFWLHFCESTFLFPLVLVRTSNLSLIFLINYFFICLLSLICMKMKKWSGSYIFQDYVETLQRLSDSSFFDLFQRKYAHSLIVSLPILFLLYFPYFILKFIAAGNLLSWIKIVLFWTYGRLE